MKAAALTGIKEISLIDIPKPGIKNPDDVLIRIKSIGVCGSDMHYYKEGQIGTQVVQFPFIMGHEFAGVVTEAGSGVSDLKPGDRVAVDPNIHCGKCDQCLNGRPHTCLNGIAVGVPGQVEGCNTEYIVVPARNCFVIPDNMSFDEGMLVEPFSIGYYATSLAGELKGKDIAIFGFGPIGMSVFQALTMQSNGKVIVSEKLSYRGEFAIKQGADLFVNPDEQNIAEKVKGILPYGVDVAFDATGSQEAVDDAVRILKPGGTLLIIGIPDFDKWSFRADEMRRKELTIRNVRRQNGYEQKAIDAIAAGKVNVAQMVTHRFTLEQTAKAYELVEGYSDGVMKAVIEIND
ncbi:MAG: alcohol dehydrogenase catalytic domain-containing protein [Chlorobi bacterium]|nr:alcohol dehydrogenase catalytic domain-containing protein [Chlorobiota bacterium]